MNVENIETRKDFDVVLVRRAKWLETLGAGLASIILTVAAAAKLVMGPSVEVGWYGEWLRWIAVTEAGIVLVMWTRWRSLALAMAAAVAAYGVVAAMVSKVGCGCLGPVSLGAAGHLLLAAARGASATVAMWARGASALAVDRNHRQLELGSRPAPSPCRGR